MRKRTVLVFSALIIGAGLSLVPFRPPAVRAAQSACCAYATDDQVPAAALDGNGGNRFVFWTNLDGSGLEEAYYNAGTGLWSKASTVNGMGPLGSEPTVAAGYSTTGTDGNGYQFVFWQGQPPGNHLYEAYWDGSWHGPIDLGMGELNSAPSATIDMALGVVTVVWRESDNEIWYAYTDDGNSPSHQTWSGPHEAGWGPVGNPPSAADGDTGTVQVFWQGDDGYLWHGTLDAGGTTHYGPYRINNNQLYSQPNVTGYLPPEGTSRQGEGASVYNVFWFGSGGQLWSQEWIPGDLEINPAGTAEPATEIKGMAPLGSAPSCAYWQGQLGKFYCFWAGYTSPYNLYEASASSSGVTGPTDLGDGPLKSP
jgi:hypothetical protein